MEFKCYNCSEPFEVNVNEIFSRAEECSSCNSDLRCCRMCKFYDASVYNECKEHSAERVTEKEKRNFCSYFELNIDVDAKENERQSQIDAAEALFKK